MATISPDFRNTKNLWDALWCHFWLWRNISGQDRTKKKAAMIAIQFITSATYTKGRECFRLNCLEMWMQHSSYHKCQINSITPSCFAFTRTKTPQSFWVSADGQSCRPLALPLWSSSHKEREESWPPRTKIALSWNLENFEKFCWESLIIVLWLSQVTLVLTKRENSKVNIKTGLTTFFYFVENCGEFQSRQKASWTLEQ